jgi:hypothetical protein
MAIIRGGATFKLGGSMATLNFLKTLINILLPIFWQPKIADLTDFYSNVRSLSSS